MRDENSIPYEIRNVEIVRSSIQSNREQSAFLDLSYADSHRENMRYIRGQLHRFDQPIEAIWMDTVKISSREFSFEYVQLRNKEDHLQKWESEIRIELQDGQIITDTIRTQHNSGPADNILKQETHEYVAHDFSSDAGILELGKATIELDSFSLKSSNLKISIQTLNFGDIAPLPADLKNVTGPYRAYRFLPGGVHFFQGKAKIKIPYNEDLIPPGYTAKDLKSYYFNKEKRQWVQIAVDSVDTENMLVISYVEHFTDYINGVIQGARVASDIRFFRDSF